MVLFDAPFDDEARFRHGEPPEQRFGDFLASLRATAFRFVDRHRALDDILDTMAGDRGEANGLVIVSMLVLGEFEEARLMIGKERNTAACSGGSAYAVDRRTFLRNVTAYIRNAERGAAHAGSGTGPAAMNSVDAAITRARRPTGTGNARRVARPSGT